LTNRQVNLWTILLVCLIGLYGLTVYAQAGLLPVGILVGSMIGGLVGWRKTTAHYPANLYRGCINKDPRFSPNRNVWMNSRT